MNLSLTVVRPEDLVVLGLEFRDVQFTAPAGTTPGEVGGAPNGLLIVHFQPQHVAEQAFYQVAEKIPPATPELGEPPSPPGIEVGARLAGRSRLVFAVPAGESIPFTLEGILDALPRLPVRVPPVSAFDPASTGCLPLDMMLRLLRIPKPPQIAKPADTETAIELPYRLFLAPDAFAQWTHAPAPVDHGTDWTELWHTTLGSHKAVDPRVRAVWSPDWRALSLQPHFNSLTPGTNDDPFRASLDSRDRNEIVHLTSNHYIQGFIPSPVVTERMMLTSLGAWLEVQGDWEPPTLIRTTKLTVEQWRHDATLGRDQYVRVIYRGRLLPFGHRASLVKVTERKFYRAENEEQPGYVAYLFQRMFIIVREPERTYTHRATPFRSVRLRTRVTPNLVDPAFSEAVGGAGQSAFWPRAATAGGSTDDFLFRISAMDWEGRTSEFTAPLIFADADYEANNFSALVNAYNAASDTRRRRSFNGQLVAFAPRKEPGDTSFDTAAVTFSAEPRPGEEPHFRPAIAKAEVNIPAVNQITGKPAPSEIEWEPSYLTAAGTAIGNAAEMFARVKATPLAFGSTERSGGLVAPDISISGLSRTLGPVGGPAAQMVAGSFKALDVFPSVKLLGAIDLANIVKDVIFNEAVTKAPQLPRLTSVRLPDAIRTTYEWTRTKDELISTPLFTPKDGAQFVLTAKVEQKLSPTTPAPPTMEVKGELTKFQVTLLPSAELVKLHFTSVGFTSAPGKKVDVDVKLETVEFTGILEFVNSLKTYIPLSGFSDGPMIDLVQAPKPGVDVGFQMGLPTLSVGVASLQNVTLGASLYLPFGKDPLNFRFAFCERQQPFTLTVSLFGGGGFFGLDVGLHSVVRVEAAIEFGASVALNLGVAKGEASIMAGFYFQKAGADFTLTGYFRASGSLSVIGIITVSLVFYLGLTYESKGSQPHAGMLWGQAKLTVKVEIAFFSKSVSVSMEREFAGSDPSFRELVSPTAWSEYCDAFASYA